MTLNVVLMPSEHPLISCLRSKISLFAYLTGPPWANLHIQNRLKCSKVADLCNFFSEHPVMDFPGSVRKSANFHIQHGHHGLICIWKIDVNTFYTFILYI